METRISHNRVIRALCCFLIVVILVLSWLLQQPIRGLRAYVVLTGSMKPTLPVGSLVITKSIPHSEFKVGDIVAFPAPGNNKENVIHRIQAVMPVGKTGIGVTTKGDANPIADTWTLNPLILQGKSVLVVPWLGYPVHVLTHRLGFITVVLLVFLFIVLPEVRFLVSVFTIKGSN